MICNTAYLSVKNEIVMPGDDVDLFIELLSPIAMEKESRFAIREGGVTVGAGTITEICDDKSDEEISKDFTLK